MNTHRILSGLIVITAAIFALAFATSDQAVIALPAIGAGAAWLWLENSPEPVSPVLFFLVFIGLAVLGALIGLSAPVMLVGLSAALAAWDLARFHRRVSFGEDHNIDPMLEQRHLQRLAGVIGIGWLVALLPLMIQLSINFTVFAILTLVLMGVFRASLLRLRREEAQT